MKRNNKIILFESSDGEVALETPLLNETVWLSQTQLVKLFGRDKSTISRHIKSVFDEGECERNSVVANFATTAKEGGVKWCYKFERGSKGRQPPLHKHSAHYHKSGWSKSVIKKFFITESLSILPQLF